MKIGVVQFGWASAGIAQIVRTLIEGLSVQENTIYGIECNRNTNEIELKNITKTNTSSNFGSDNTRLNSFPLEIWKTKSSQIGNQLSSLDKVIVLGGSGLKLNHLTSEVLHVPVSIFNDVDGSQYTLGYDTALNSIVKNIESVRDTASSLDYGKVRVFNVQIPGHTATKLLTESALAVEGEVVTNMNDEDEIEHIKQHIRKKENNNEGYTFLLMDQTVNPEKLGTYFTEFDLDWKIVEIDGSQCGGPYPTAYDQLIANQLKKAVVDWSLSNQSTGQLLIKDRQVLFEKKQRELA